MKILGIESASMVASVAVATEAGLLAEYTVDFKKTHSQTLLPMIDEITRMVGLDLETIDAIAVSAGPGSFTGLRIGSATAKGIGLALQKPLISVPTMDAMAYGLYGTSALICPIMDARRQQVYTGLYHFEREFEVVMPQCAMDIRELIRCLDAGYEAYVFFVIQTKGVRAFEPNDRTHPAFGEALRTAAAAGVEVMAWDCRVSPGEVWIDAPVPVVL